MAKETAGQKLLKALQNKSTSLAGVTTNKFLNKNNHNFSFSIFSINKFLIIGILICVVVLVFQFRSGVALINQKVDFTDEVKLSSRSEEVLLPETKDIKFYIDSFGNRNIFKPYDISLGKATQSKPNLAKRFSKYKLVGVAWLDLPESTSIMIEDSQTKMTYILKAGEQLEGVTIKTIYTDRVVFSYENEETTIKL